jgi:hypothetical protein
MKLPTLDSFSTRMPALRVKQAELHVEINKRKASCAVIRARMQEAPNPGNEHEVRLRKLLGEEPVAVTLPDAQQLKELLAELEILNAALGTINAEIQKETRLASNKLLEAVRPEVMGLGGKFADAFLALRSAHLEYIEFIDSVEATGANIETLRVRPHGLSDPRDLSGNYPYGLRDFADAGFMSKSLAPKAI